MTRKIQQQLTQAPISNSTTPNIDPSGDTMQPAKDDGIIRIAFQNAHGIKLTHGLQLSDEIDVIDSWNIDIMGLAETNRPWTTQQRTDYNFKMNLRFRTTRTNFAAAPNHSHT